MNNAFKNQQKKYSAKIAQRRRTPDNAVVRAFIEPKIDSIRNNVPNINKQTKLLDVGGGSGFFSFYFENFIDNVVCLDFSEEMLSINPCKNKVLGDANALFYSDDEFDIVFCSNLLHHLSDPIVAVQEMRRVSRKYVILHEPNRTNPLMFLFGATVRAERGALRFSRSHLENLARKAGLHILSSQSIGGVLPNKTPKMMLPLFKLLDHVPLVAFYNMVICEVC